MQCQYSFLYFNNFSTNRTVITQLLKMSLSMWKVGGSIPRPVKSDIDTVQPAARHRCDVSSELCCPGARSRGRAPPLVATLRYYSECNETSIMKI